MTPKEFEKAISELYKKYKDDPEKFHGESDDLMCFVLNSLGYNKGVEIFRNADKWYA